MTRDSAGRDWDTYLNPLHVMRLAIPYHDPTPFPPGYWRDTKHIRKAPRRDKDNE